MFPVRIEGTWVSSLHHRLPLLSQSRSSSCFCDEILHLVGQECMIFVSLEASGYRFVNSFAAHEARVMQKFNLLISFTAVTRSSMIIPQTLCWILGDEMSSKCMICFLLFRIKKPVQTLISISFVCSLLHPKVGPPKLLPVSWSPPFTRRAESYNSSVNLDLHLRTLFRKNLVISSHLSYVIRNPKREKFCCSSTPVEFLYCAGGYMIYPWTGPRPHDITRR
jgi:hypothetical protein